LKQISGHLQILKSQANEMGKEAKKQGEMADDILVKFLLLITN